MAVPEAPMDEDNLASPAENDVGFTREVASVKTIAVAETVQQPSNSHFERCILAPNCPHIRASCFGS
jgi:hypothetical protein